MDDDGSGTVDRGEKSVYDGGNIALAWDQGGSLTDRFLYGPALDQLFADEDALGEILWALGDNQNTVRDLVSYDDLAGTTTVENHIKYDTFGNITGESNSAVELRHAYTGQDWDPDAGMYYYCARWYEAGTALFLSEDPSGFAAGDTNLYRYVGNSPTNFTDPTGLVASPTPQTMMNPNAYRAWYYAYTQEIQAGAVMPADPGGGPDWWDANFNPAYQDQYGDWLGSTI